MYISREQIKLVFSRAWHSLIHNPPSLLLVVKFSHTNLCLNFSAKLFDTPKLQPKNKMCFWLKSGSGIDRGFGAKKLSYIEAGKEDIVAVLVLYKTHHTSTK